jgi:two-component system, OmpR family, sensor kinase
MMRRPRTLRSRLFSWFVGAILLAMLTSSLVVFATRPEQGNVADAVARNVAAELGRTWDDEEATRSYLAQVRRVTGLDARLVSDPHRLPARVYRLAERGAAIVPDGFRRVFVPVTRGGTVVGALEIYRFGLGWAPGASWRFVLALLLVLGVLLAMAGVIADQLARPLERLADAADRFGGGDLKARTRPTGTAGRWVAREVLEVATSFNRMADRVEDIVRSQRELLGAISHELRSPLGRAHVALEIARDRLGTAPGPRPAAASLDEIETQLDQVNSILGDLLDVARTGLTDLRKEKLDLAAWLRQVIAQEPTPPNVELVVEPSASGLDVVFDPSLLARVIHNLLENARTHGHPSDRAIEVRIAHTGPMASIVVRDRGPGLPPGFAEKAFEPFMRAEPSRTRPATGSGSGLGLAIVRRVVEAHAGSVYARNADGGGAEIGVELPVSRASL